MKINVKFLANTKGNLSINLTPLTNHPSLRQYIHSLFANLPTISSYINPSKPVDEGYEINTRT